MRRPLSRSWLFFSLFLLSAFNILPLHAKPAAAPPIAVSVEKAFDYSANGARVPLRVKLENTTGSDRKATLQFHEGWNGNRRTSHTYPFFIPARESVHAVVYPLLSYNLVYEVKENHEGVSPIPTDTEHRKMVAVIQEGAPAYWHLLSESSYNAAVSSCDLMKWPADYRMYEGQTCLIIPEKTYRTHFDEAHRKAIRQWVTGGGNLWLIGDRGLSVSTRLLGNGRILHVPSLDGLPEEEKKLKLKEFINLHEKGNCYPEITSAAPYYFSAPSTTLGLGLIIFAVLVGPLSLFLWAPAGKRQRLFLLIPAISVGFSLLLLLLILAGDGTGGTGSREVLIQVNPQDHSALISQNQICKTSVLLNNTFQLPENAGITGARMSKARGSIKEKTIEGAARQGEECGGKWFTSRSTLQHRIIMPVSTRAALTLLETRPGGAPVFQSTFPGTLNGLTYRDASGKYWTLEQLPPGRKMQASPFLPEEEPDGPPPLHFRASMEPAGGELGPIPTLPSINWEKTSVTVSGPVTPLPHE